MKSVAIVITRMIPGGASNIVSQIIGGGQNRYNFTLFTGEEDCDSKIVDRLADCCRVVKIPELVRNISLMVDYSAYKRLTGELKKGNFDIVHTHTSKAGFVGRFAAHKAMIPNIIHSSHGTIYSSDTIEGVPKSSLGKKMLQYAEIKAGGIMNYLTVLSEHEKKICIDLGLSKTDNTIVIPNGIEVAKFAFAKSEKQQARRTLGIKEGELVLVSIGRLSREKGHTILLESFRELIKEYHQVKLVLVGDGPERKSLETQAADLCGKVFFAGHQDNIKPYLAAADIFINPSYYEGFGIAILEAMASRIPVIASSAGGVPEIINDEKEGLLFPAGKVEILIKRIKDLIDSVKLRELIAEKGYKRSLEFTTDKMLGKYFQLYG